MKRYRLLFLPVCVSLCCGCGDKKEDAPPEYEWPRVECGLMAILQNNYWTDDAYFVREVRGVIDVSECLNEMSLFEDHQRGQTQYRYSCMGPCRIDPDGKIQRYMGAFGVIPGVPSVWVSPDYSYRYDPDKQVLHIMTERAVFCHVGFAANQDLHLIRATENEVVFELPVPDNIREIYHAYIDNVVVRLRLVWTRMELNDRERERYENAPLADESQYMEFWQEGFNQWE